MYRISPSLYSREDGRGGGIASPPAKPKKVKIRVHASPRKNSKIIYNLEPFKTYRMESVHTNKEGPGEDHWMTVVVHDSIGFCLLEDKGKTILERVSRPLQILTPAETDSNTNIVLAVSPIRRGWRSSPSNTSPIDSVVSSSSDGFDYFIDGESTPAATTASTTTATSSTFTSTSDGSGITLASTSLSPISGYTAVSTSTTVEDLSYSASEGTPPESPFILPHIIEPSLAVLAAAGQQHRRQRGQEETKLEQEPTPTRLPKIERDGVFSLLTLLPLWGAILWSVCVSISMGVSAILAASISLVVRTLLLLLMGFSCLVCVHLLFLGMFELGASLDTTIDVVRVAN
jgi:hypothetical protein